MGFREMLHDVIEVDEQVSVVHDLQKKSLSMGHVPMIFSNIVEAPGHRAAVNALDRGRICKYLGVDAGDLIDILSWAMENPSEPEIVSKDDAPVLQNTMEVTDLNVLPIPWHYSQDGGRYQSASIIIAEYSGIRNTSFHRQLVKDSRKTVSRFVPRHLKTMTEKARESGDEIPIVVVNGPDPLVLLAGAMSFDDHIDELKVAASLHKKIYNDSLKLVKMSNGLLAPANAEYAMEARITLEKDDEGPYVDITGTVDDIRQEAVIEYDHIHHKNDPIFHALIPAGLEHMTLMGMPRAPTIKNAVSKVVNCTDVYLTEGGCGWLSSVVQIIPENEGDGQKAILAALGGHKSMKQVIVVDSDIDVTDSSRVEWALMTRWQPDSDTVILSKQKGSSLDPSRDSGGLTSKIGMDATLPLGVDRTPYQSVL